MITLHLENVSEESGTFYWKYSIFSDDEEVGSASVSTNGLNDENAYVERIDIYEENRSRGYGSAALKALACDFWKIWLAPDNESAKRLYSRMGKESYDVSFAPYVDQGFGVYCIDSDKYYNDFEIAKKQRIQESGLDPDEDEEDDEDDEDNKDWDFSGGMTA